MDASAFDRLARLVSTACSRRSLGGLGLGSLAALLGVDAVEAAPCPKGRKRCRGKCIPRRRCCTSDHCRPGPTGRVCRKGRCVCPPARPQRCAGRCVPQAECCGGCPPEQACHAGSCCIATSAGLQAALLPGGPAQIRLCPNTTYPGSFTIARNLTVIGAGAASSILDGGGTQRVVTVSSAVTQAGLRGLGIRGGDGDFEGGGILTAGVLLLIGCRVTDNVSSGIGGGIYVRESTLTLVDTVVSGNQADVVGGGIFVHGGVLTLQGTSRVEDNEAPSGGGILGEVGSSITLHDQSQVARNTATDGGGIFAFDTTVILRDDSRVEDNTATGSGGGLWIQRNTTESRLELRDRSSVTLNKALGGDDSGGGLFVLNDGTVVEILDQAVVADNTPDNCQPDISTSDGGTCS